MWWRQLVAGGGAGAGEERGYGREGGECGRDGAGEERGYGREGGECGRDGAGEEGEFGGGGRVWQGEGECGRGRESVAGGGMGQVRRESLEGYEQAREDMLSEKRRLR